MKRIILRLEGGLGNQLFQYAFAKALQKMLGGKIMFDLHTFKSDDQRNISLHHLNLNEDSLINKNTASNNVFIFFFRIWFIIINSLTLKKRNDISRKIRSFCGVFYQIEPNYSNYIYCSPFPVKYIIGNWMSEKYFLNIKSSIKEEFTVKTKPNKENFDLINKIQNENSICVHIRRGDYTNSQWASKLLICDYNYYCKAIDIMNSKIKNAVFYIFSNNNDDINWIKKNYKFNVEVNYIELNNPDYEELRLMYNCKHFIISNSSFSWWASYLSSHEDKIIIAPSKWNNNIWDMKDIYLDHWIKIENSNE